MVNLYGLSFLNIKVNAKLNLSVSVSVVMIINLRACRSGVGDFECLRSH